MEHDALLAVATHLKKAPVAGEPLLRKDGYGAVRQCVLTHPVKNVSPQPCKGYVEGADLYHSLQVKPVVNKLMTKSQCDRFQGITLVEAPGADRQSCLFQSLPVVGYCFNQVVE